ncbi:MAG: nuclease, partial [Bifidobacterium crudilactis]|nr:nuclease [Bifidobacterium crudilactis]
FSFLLQGGDNFRTLAKGKDTRDSGLVDRDAWISYISQNSPLSADYARRSVAVKGLPSSEVKAGASFTADFSKLSLTSVGAAQETQLVASVNGVEVGKSDVADGNFQLTVTIPAGISGGLTLQVKGVSTGLTMS